MGEETSQAGRYELHRGFVFPFAGRRGSPSPFGLLLVMRTSRVPCRFCGLRPAPIACSVDRGNPVCSIRSRNGMALSRGRIFVAHSSRRGSMYSL